MARPIMTFKSPKSCPKCGGEPEINLAMYGRVKYIICNSCQWEGGTRDLELSASSALEHWNDKVKKEK